MIKCYTASKMSDYQLWRQLRTDWKEVEFTAHWPFEYTDPIKADKNLKYAHQWWTRDQADIERSDCLLIYTADSKNAFRGALVEVGMALAGMKPVITVGEHPDYGTWQYHPLVRHAQTLEVARDFLKIFASQIEPV